MPTPLRLRSGGEAHSSCSSSQPAQITSGVSSASRGRRCGDGLPQSTAPSPGRGRVPGSSSSSSSLLLAAHQQDVRCCSASVSSTATLPPAQQSTASTPLSDRLRSAVLDTMVKPLPCALLTKAVSSAASVWSGETSPPPSPGVPPVPASLGVGVGVDTTPLRRQPSPPPLPPPPRASQRDRREHKNFRKRASSAKARTEPSAMQHIADAAHLRVLQAPLALRERALVDGQRYRQKGVCTAPPPPPPPPSPLPRSPPLTASSRLTVWVPEARDVVMSRNAAVQVETTMRSVGVGSVAVAGVSVCVGTGTVGAAVDVCVGTEGRADVEMAARVAVLEKENGRLLDMLVTAEETMAAVSLRLDVPTEHRHVQTTAPATRTATQQCGAALSSLQDAATQGSTPAKPILADAAIQTTLRAVLSAMETSTTQSAPTQSDAETTAHPQCCDASAETDVVALIPNELSVTALRAERADGTSQCERGDVPGGTKEVGVGVVGMEAGWVRSVACQKYASTGVREMCAGSTQTANLPEVCPATQRREWDAVEPVERSLMPTSLLLDCVQSILTCLSHLAREEPTKADHVSRASEHLLSLLHTHVGQPYQRYEN